MMTYDVVVLGAGAAGMMCAAEAGAAGVACCCWNTAITSAARF